MANLHLLLLFNDMMPPSEKQLVSVGGACELLKITPDQLHVFMKAAEIQFATRVDGIPYMSGADFELVRDKLVETVEAIEVANKRAEKFAAN